jgi:hypothetical protein
MCTSFGDDRMSETPVQKFTLGDVKRVTEGLGHLLGVLDAIRTGHHTDEHAFADSSIGSTDVERGVGVDQIEDLLGHVNMRMVAAIDHADHLATLGAQAASGRPTPTYAPVSVSRSTIELAAEAAWLVEEGVDPVMRVGRSLSVQWYEASSAESVSVAVDPKAYREIRAEAVSLGLPEKGKNARVTFGEPRPGRRKLVDRLVGAPWYSVLSAAAHGETWALIEFGYAIASVTGEDESWGLTMKKEPPAWGMWMALSLALRGIGRAGWDEARYRGWDTDVLLGALTESYGHARIADEHRFWEL